jgi:poly-gamma-glutamate capsule biosynthesis protein CapA/YwtB (metallophosphatase superfamily)
VVTIALAGDTMLGRGVAERLHTDPPTSLVAPEVVELTRAADVFLLNLECCISERGEPIAIPGKPFFFRAPPGAVETLTYLGADCVTLANNHALDFGEVALLDTLEHLRSGGIRVVGAGPDESSAREPVVVETNGFRLEVAAFTDHPSLYAARPDHPGVAFGGLRLWVPSWITEVVDAARARSDAVLVTAHWGPNMTTEPREATRRAARALEEAGAALVAGHSAHVFHGVAGRVLYDLGDFLDDYHVDAELRNDLGLLWLVTLDSDGPRRLEAVPLKLDYCFTRLAGGDDAAWIRRRFRQACAALGTEVAEEDGRLVVTW